MGERLLYVSENFLLYFINNLLKFQNFKYLIRHVCTSLSLYLLKITST